MSCAAPTPARRASANPRHVRDPGAGAVDGRRLRPSPGGTGWVRRGDLGSAPDMPAARSGREDVRLDIWTGDGRAAVTGSTAASVLRRELQRRGSSNRGASRAARRRRPPRRLDPPRTTSAAVGSSTRAPKVDGVRALERRVADGARRPARGARPPDAGGGRREPRRAPSRRPPRLADDRVSGWGRRSTASRSWSLMTATRGSSVTAATEARRPEGPSTTQFAEPETAAALAPGRARGPSTGYPGSFGTVRFPAGSAPGEAGPGSTLAGHGSRLVDRRFTATVSDIESPGRSSTTATLAAGGGRPPRGGFGVRPGAWRDLPRRRSRPRSASCRARVGGPA